MERDTYEAIKTEWCKISNTEQRSLIYRYIQGDSNGLRGSWMEFLRKQFLITPGTQLQDGAALFTGLCSPNGESVAPMDGFMASR